MPLPIQKQYPTFDDIYKLVLNIAEQIRAAGQDYDFILGPPRGGLIPAVMLSHQLSIKMANRLDSRKGLFLIVDDIADTGKTLKHYGKLVHTATLHYKPQSVIKPTYFAKEVWNSDWIVYPWELQSSNTVQDYLKA